jgi:hypothetical protein
VESAYSVDRCPFRRWFWVRVPANPFSEKGRLSLVTKATPLESRDEQERNEKPENQ